MVRHYQIHLVLLSLIATNNTTRTNSAVNKSSIKETKSFMELSLFILFRYYCTNDDKKTFLTLNELDSGSWNIVNVI